MYYLVLQLVKQIQTKIVIGPSCGNNGCLSSLWNWEHNSLEQALEAAHETNLIAVALIELVAHDHQWQCLYIHAKFTPSMLSSQCFVITTFAGYKSVWCHWNNFKLAQDRHYLQPFKIIIKSMQIRCDVNQLKSNQTATLNQSKWHSKLQPTTKPKFWKAVVHFSLPAPTYLHPNSWQNQLQAL